MLTPKITGSVIPREAESVEGTAIFPIFQLQVLMLTARQVPNYVKFVVLTTGIQMLKPTESSILASIILYTWWRPTTTIAR